MMIDGCELILVGKKLTLLMEGDEILCSSEGNPLCRGNTTRKASEKLVVALNWWVSRIHDIAFL
jgi:hypothetical protein